MIKIKCDHELANKYQEKLEEFGWPSYLFNTDTNTELVTFAKIFDEDLEYTIKILELFVELVEKGATVCGNLLDEEILIRRVLALLRKLQETK